MKITCSEMSCRYSHGQITKCTVSNKWSWLTVIKATFIRRIHVTPIHYSDNMLESSKRSEVWKVKLKWSISGQRGQISLLWRSPLKVRHELRRCVRPLSISPLSFATRPVILECWHYRHRHKPRQPGCCQCGRDVGRYAAIELDGNP